jgi:hypothetical protein
VLRKLVKTALPVSRVTMALWAWHNRDELMKWAGFLAGVVPDVVDGRSSDVIAEAKLRARLTADSRTRGAEGLRVTVEDGVATLSGVVEPDIHDVALDLATATTGITRVRDDVQHPARRPKFAFEGARS